MSVKYLSAARTRLGGIFTWTFLTWRQRTVSGLAAVQMLSSPKRCSLAASTNGEERVVEFSEARVAPQTPHLTCSTTKHSSVRNTRFQPLEEVRFLDAKKSWRTAAFWTGFIPRSIFFFKSFSFYFSATCVYLLFF